MNRPAALGSWEQPAPAFLVRAPKARVLAGPQVPVWREQALLAPSLAGWPVVVTGQRR